VAFTGGVIDPLAAGAAVDLVSSSPAEASMTQTATQQATTSRPDHIYPTLSAAQVARIAAVHQGLHE